MNHRFFSTRLAAIGIVLIATLLGMLYIDQLSAIAISTDETVLFADDFSGDLSQWSDSIGDWYIDQGELVGTGWGGGTDAWIYAGDTGWTDYALQAKLIFVNDNAILVLRSTGHWWNEYRLEFWQQGGESSNTYSVYKYQDGNGYDLSGGLVPSPVPITNPSVVQVMVTGNRLLIFINGTFVDEIVDPNPLTNGRIGLGVIWYYTSHFDDVMVTTLPPVMMLPPEQEKFGEVGDTVTYSIELENHTGDTDSFDLELLPGNAWATTLSTDQVGPLEDGESITLTAWVEISPGAQPGDSDTATIQATSVTSPSLTAEAVINTTVTSGELAYVPMGGSDGLALIDTQTHSTIGALNMAQLGCDYPQRARLTPDGAELYVMCEVSQNIVILDTSDLSLVATIDHPGVCQQDVAFVQFGAYALASTSGCGGIYEIDVIDAATRSIIQTIPTSGYDVISIAAHPYLPLAYAACWSGGVCVIDTNTFAVKTIIPYSGLVWDVQPSPDGLWVYASEYYGNGLAKIDVSTNTVVDTLPGYGKFGLDISPDGSKIYASEGWDGVVQVIDAATMDYITTVYLGAITFENALTCDGSELYVSRETTSIPVIDTQTYSITYDVPIPGAATPYGITICPQFMAEGVFLIPPEQAKDGGRGETVSYQEKLFNNSGITDTFYLEGIDYLWETHLSTDQVGPLQDGETASFTVTVTVPEDAPWYDTDSVTIVAYAAMSPTLRAESQIVTTAFAPAQISVDPGSLESTQYYGTVTTQEMTISNGEGVTLTYDIQAGEGEILRIVSDDQWRVSENYESGWEQVGFDDSGWEYTISPAGNCAGEYCWSEPDHDDVRTMWSQNQYDYQTIYLRRSFMLDTSNVISATVWSGCDDDHDLYINGVLVVSDWNWGSGPTFVTDIAPYLTTGINTLAVKASDSFGICRSMCVDATIVMSPQLWVTVEPVSGTVPTTSSIPIEVTFDATEVQPGVHETALFVNSNDPLEPLITVQVTMTVEATEDMGQVTGSVSDAWTGDPIAATVDLEGVFSMQATPDYSIWAVEGAYSLTAYAEGYYTVTLPVEIIAGEVTEQDIALEPALPRLGELPEEITMSLLEGTTGEQELELFNEGPVPLEFAFFEIEPLKGLGTENHLAGMKILYDRAHCQGDLYYYNSLTSDLTNAGATINENFDPFDEDTLEGYNILWLNDGSCGWTYGELNILVDWLAQGGSIMVQSESTPAAAMPASIFGITYQGGNCFSGTTSSINEHPISEGVDAFYIEWTCGYITGSPVSVVLDPWYMNPHVIAAEQGRGKMVVVADNDFYDWVIDNNDNRRLAMNAFQWLAVPVFSDIPWLSENPEQGSVPGHDSLPVELGFDAGELTPGVYEGILVLENNDPAQPSTIDIPVTLNVLATEAALSIEPEEAARPGSPGETIVYTFTLTNLGNVVDSFTLEVSGTWTTTLSADSTGALDPGETFTFVVSVTIPLEAMHAEQDLAVVTATSEHDPQVSASAQATTTAIVIPVEVYLRYLPLAFKN